MHTTKVQPIFSPQIYLGVTFHPNLFGGCISSKFICGSPPLPPGHHQYLAPKFIWGSFFSDLSAGCFINHLVIPTVVEDSIKINNRLCRFPYSLALQFICGSLFNQIHLPVTSSSARSSFCLLPFLLFTSLTN